MLSFQVVIYTNASRFEYEVQAETLIDACKEGVALWVQKNPENTDQLVAIEADWID